MVATGGCGLYALCKHISSQKREWLLLGLISGAFFFGDLYWFLYLYFYGETPPAISMVSEFSWYASMCFLILLLQYAGGDHLKERTSKLPWAGPVFAGVMCIYFMTMGDYASNIIMAVLMGAILYYSIQGMILFKGSDSGKKHVFTMAFIFCVLEYSLWMLSVIWIGGESARNPYYWCDVMISLWFILMIPAVRKAVDE